MNLIDYNLVMTVFNKPHANLDYLLGFFNFFEPEYVKEKLESLVKEGYLSYLNGYLVTKKGELNLLKRKNLDLEVFTFVHH